jgi:hypothetical protein
MSPDKQRIAIAEACGWVRGRGNIVRNPSNVFSRSGEKAHKDSLPDYLNDLNAMHEAEEIQGFHKLNDAAWEYRTKLQGIVVPPALLYAATAAQRAEAFLRTLNLWK